VKTAARVRAVKEPAARPRPLPARGPDEAEAPPPPPAARAAERLRAELVRRVGRPIEDDAPFYGLGLDSLSLASLSNWIEAELGVVGVDPYRDNTLRRLSAAVAARAPHALAPSLLARLAQHARARPDERALILPSPDGARELGWRELFDAVCARGRQWRALGLRPGDRVVIVTDAVAEQILSFLGVLAAGGQPAIFSHPSMKQSASRFTATFAAILRASGARWVLAADAFVPMLASLESELPARLVATEELLAAAAAGELALPTEATFLQFSSGTTGVRKGVAISAAMLAAQCASYGRAIGLSTGDVVVSWLPLYHDMGLVGALLLPLFEGVTSVQLSPFDWVQRPETLFASIDRHQGTLVWLPNFAFQLLARRVRDEQLRGLRLDSVRMLIDCSEPVRDDTLRAFVERFGRYGLDATKLHACYAMAENTFAVTQTTGGAGARRVFAERRALAEGRFLRRDTPDASTVTLVSCGTPIAGTSVRIAAPAADVIGEVELRGDCLFTHYLDDASRDAPVDGWYRTGDLGCIVDGELVVTGRKKDLIISRGINVYPEDVEAIVHQVDGVKPGRAVVFGVWDEGAGTEQIVALLEATRDAGGDLVARAREAVFEHAGVTLHDCVLCDPGELLKSTSGKLSRGANRARYLARLSAGTSAPP
jgi:acyl-CoA synthetase (AMP-forming)/AMP-acid ligase II